MPDLKSQDLVTHSFHHLKEKAFILPPAAQKEISRQKNVLPRNKFINSANAGNDSNLLIVFYVQIMPDDFVMQLHRF
ncbi:hypothetical protein CV012_11565 [Klebsiella pneumoniae]|nr:hypothetical protein CV705_04300 [Klebsiella pneumoniae]PTD74897.1 hypothetical protein CV703_25790 [Klebsiella pneumoniae]PTD75944.1 hypothetical protein CV704_04295 [Klebsiella pneumoniae]PTD85178.1 hypothetical protein CV012_11565 [Klebsiella pneumoniae]